MKTFTRTSLPLEIKYNNITYKLNTNISTFGMKISDFINLQKSIGKKIVLCKVLSSALKNRTDLYGLPYMPTQWIFVAE